MRNKEKTQMEITFYPIGVVHSPFKELSDMPIQPVGDHSESGVVEIFDEFTEGLKDIDGFSHIMLIYYFHRVEKRVLTVIPFLDKEQRGIFATRAPVRPNPIGLSVVRLVERAGSKLKVDDLDILDGTPLLDIKPYIPEFDHRPDAAIGWLEDARGRVAQQRSDERFSG
jgi:tRNA-Thr(GGU) m(6)t(6)A37 methyltransferase TsaA